LSCSPSPAGAADVTAAASGMSDRSAETEQAVAIERLLDARGGRRDFVPVRRTFLQVRAAGGGAAPLAAFVTDRRKRALELYLLIHALASTEPWDVASGWQAWAAALGMPETAASQVSVSKTLGWLERVKLIRRVKDGRRRRIYLLDESGSGAECRHPARSRAPDYFKLPYAYWREGWHARLDLPATSVLLTALSLRSTFVLPLDNGASWYGISRDTLRRGLRGLTDAGLVTFRSRFKQTLKSPTGATEERRYTLQGSFAARERRARRAPITARR
jgi:DNA-binding transcriptional ArsR family regulator